MKKKYPNLMMQSASSYDTSRVKENVEAQIKEDQEESPVSTKEVELSDNRNDDISIAVVPIKETAISANQQEQIIVPAATKSKTKPKLRQQAYYLTEYEIKTIKRLSYELDIPKSDLVRKFIDEGIARIDQLESQD